MKYSTEDAGFGLASRRSFIQAAGKGIIGATLLGSMPGLAFAQGVKGGRGSTKPIQLKPLDHPSEKPDGPLPAPMPPDRRVGFALVGLGHLTLEELLPAFAHCKKAKPVALVSGDKEKARKAALQYGIPTDNIYSYESFDDIRKNPDIDAVYIVLPNSMHHEYTIRAAKAGKHVLCEKPMANSVAEAQEMIDTCRRERKKLMIAYRIQYEPKNALVKKWTRAAKFGKVRLIEAVNVQNIGDPEQWRLKKRLSGGGALPDIGVYNINTIRYLLGEEPDWVSASVYSTPGDERFKEVEETVLFQMHFPGGTLANCSTSYGVHNSKRYRLYGDRGGWYGLDPAFNYTGLKMEVSQVTDGEEYLSHPLIPEKNQFALELDHMASCILEDKEPYTPGAEGLQDMKIIEALYRSAREGRKIMLENIGSQDPFRGPKPPEE